MKTKPRIDQLELKITVTIQGDEVIVFSESKWWYNHGSNSLQTPGRSDYEVSPALEAALRELFPHQTRFYLVQE
ncbi:MAG: hypothetical protein AAB421_02255 [Patescibacteria group bacterium]